MMKQRVGTKKISRKPELMEWKEFEIKMEPHPDPDDCTVKIPAELQGLVKHLYHININSTFYI